MKTRGRKTIKNKSTKATNHSLNNDNDSNAKRTLTSA